MAIAGILGSRLGETRFRPEHVGPTPTPPLAELASSCWKLEWHTMGQTLLEEKGTSTQQSGPAVPSPGQPQAWSDGPRLGSGYRFYCY